jgi:hypothetical protein
MSDPSAFHEFAMFGRKRLYLSHYPMFHAVHAYQAIAEARLSRGGRDWTSAVLSELARHPKRLYTLSPSKRSSKFTRRRSDWRLPSTFCGGKTFNADVHWGGKKDQFLARDLSATLTGIIFFRQFQEEDRHNRRLSYIVFGEQDDLYLAHYITVQPDFDQLVAVEAVNGSPIRPFTKLLLPRPDGKTTRLRRKGERIQGELVGMAGPGPVTALQYPSFASGHERAARRRTRINLRVLRELYYSQIDEEG